MKKRSTIKFLESQFNIYMNTNIILALVMILLGLILYAIPSAAIKTVSWLIGLYFYYSRNNIYYKLFEKRSN